MSLFDRLGLTRDASGRFRFDTDPETGILTGFTPKPMGPMTPVEIDFSADRFDFGPRATVALDIAGAGGAGTVFSGTAFGEGGSSLMVRASSFTAPDGQGSAAASVTATGEGGFGMLEVAVGGASVTDDFLF